MKKILFCISLFIALSCADKYESNIPNYPVYLELDLSFEDKDLKAPMAHKNYIKGTTHGMSASEQTGFGGILVYHGYDSDGSDAYFAFDLSCPNETLKNTRISVDSDGIYAICPKCGSKYELLNGFGNPVEGPALQNNFYLKKYYVTMRGNKIYVQN